MICKKTISGIAFLFCGTIIDIAILVIGALCMYKTTAYFESYGYLWQTIFDMKLIIPFIIGCLLMVIGIFLIILGIIIKKN